MDDSARVKRKRKISPTKLTLRRLRKTGWTCEKVEHRSQFFTKEGEQGQFRRGATKDLFGFCDVLAVRADGRTLAVQCTDATSVSKRLAKLRGLPAVAVCQGAGWKVEVWGWALRKKFWSVRRVAL